MYEARSAEYIQIYEAIVIEFFMIDLKYTNRYMCSKNW